MTAAWRVKKNNEKKISESIAARALSREKSVDAYLFTLLRFHVHELMHCNWGKKSRKGSVFALVIIINNASRMMIFPPVREKLNTRDDDYTYCTLTPTRLKLRRRRISAKQTARPLCSDRWFPSAFWSSWVLFFRPWLMIFYLRLFLYEETKRLDISPHFFSSCVSHMM